MKALVLPAMSWLCLLFLSIGTLAEESTPVEQKAALCSQSPIPETPRTIDPVEVLPDCLTKRVSVTFQDWSLREFQMWLQETLEIPVPLDEMALEDAGVSPEETVHGTADNEPVYLLIERVLEQATEPLSYYVREQHLGERSEKILFITDILTSGDTLISRAYNVASLLEQGYQVDDLILLIQEQVAGPWMEIDGVGGFTQSFGETLFVRQTRPMQEQIQALLLALKNPARQTFVLVPHSDIEMLDQLNRQVTVDLEKVPFEQAFRGLFKQVGLSIEFDLEAVFIEQEQPVTLKSPPVSLKTALQLIARSPLTVVPQSGQLVLTDWRTSEETPYLAVYNVCDLCQGSAEKSVALKKIIQEDSSGRWLNIDGVGSSLTILSQPSVFVLRAPLPIHQEVLELLTMLRKSQQE